MDKGLEKVAGGAFTFEGYNNKPMPCLEPKCKGYVHPTVNANVGRCDTCQKTYNWGTYHILYKDKNKK